MNDWFKRPTTRVTAAMKPSEARSWYLFKPAAAALNRCAAGVSSRGGLGCHLFVRAGDLDDAPLEDVEMTLPVKSPRPLERTLAHRLVGRRIVQQRGDVPRKVRHLERLGQITRPRTHRDRRSRLIPGHHR